MRQQQNTTGEQRQPQKKLQQNKPVKYSDPAPDASQMFGLHSWCLVGGFGKNPVVDDLKAQLKDCGHNVFTVNPYGGKSAEAASVSEVPIDFPIDVLHLCVNPVVGEKMLREAQARGCRNVYAQPGAESPELAKLAGELGMAFRKGCVLVDMELPAL